MEEEEAPELRRDRDDPPSIGEEKMESSVDANKESVALLLATWPAGRRFIGGGGRRRASSS